MGPVEQDIKLFIKKLAKDNKLIRNQGVKSILCYIIIHHLDDYKEWAEELGSIKE